MAFVFIGGKGLNEPWKLKCWVSGGVAFLPILAAWLGSCCALPDDVPSPVLCPPPWCALRHRVPSPIVCPPPWCVLPHRVPSPIVCPPPCARPCQRGSLKASDLRLLLLSGVEPLSGRIKTFTPYVASRPLSSVKITDVMISIVTNLISKKKTKSMT